MNKMDFKNYANERMKTLPVVHGETIDIYMMESYRARDLFQNANVEKYSVIEQLPDGSFYERIFACKETKKQYIKSLIQVFLLVFYLAILLIFDILIRRFV